MQSLESFIAESSAVHGGRYSYEKAVWNGCYDKITITCPDHGDFYQTPYKHIRGSKCIHCAGKGKGTKESFIAKARAVHGDRYDYGNVAYSNNSAKVEVICREHGPFFTKPNNHLTNKSGCPKCFGTPKLTKEEFVRRARLAHGDKYDYSLSEYTGVNNKITIICPEHGEFSQIAFDHMKGRGCIPCGVEKCAASNRSGLTEFIHRANEFHNGKFNYSRSVYVNATTKIEIICPEHGSFWQIPQDHITRYGCIACAGLEKISAKQFITRARKVHGDKYEYDESTYYAYRGKTRIICALHGEFLQTPKDHIEKRSGCPLCAREATSSSGENQIADWLSAIGVEFVRNTRDVLDGLELDIYIPDKNIGIEYNGAYWHSDNNLPHPRLHERKAMVAEKKNVRLIAIWDFQWEEKNALVKRHIEHAIGIHAGNKIHARTCKITTPTNRQCSTFYDAFHIQGQTNNAKVNLGLEFGGELVAAMSFTQSGSRRGKTGNDEWELIRFATNGIIRGGASKLFNAFIRAHNPDVIWSFSDRQHFGGELYNILGFSVDGHVRSEYSLFHQGKKKRWHKSAWQRRNIPRRLAELGVDDSFDPAIDARTERQVQDQHKVLRVMDYGKIRWRWTKKDPAQRPGIES